MSLLDYFKRNKNEKSAQTAKDRLQIIVAHERAQREQPDFLPAMKRDLLEVICRYVDVSPSDLEINVETNGDNLSVLEVNATLPR